MVGRRVYNPDSRDIIHDILGADVLLAYRMAGTGLGVWHGTLCAGAVGVQHHKPNTRQPCTEAGPTSAWPAIH